MGRSSRLGEKSTLAPGVSATVVREAPREFHLQARVRLAQVGIPVKPIANPQVPLPLRVAVPNAVHVDDTAPWLVLEDEQQATLTALVPTEEIALGLERSHHLPLVNVWTHPNGHVDDRLRDDPLDGGGANLLDSRRLPGEDPLLRSSA